MVVERGSVGDWKRKVGREQSGMSIVHFDFKGMSARGSHAIQISTEERGTRERELALI